MAEARVVLTEDAGQDLRALDGAAREIVASGIGKLHTDLALRGARLEGDGRPDWVPQACGRQSHVYRVEADGTVAVVLIIDGRADEKAYRLAVARVDTYAGPSKAAAAAEISAVWGR